MNYVALVTHAHTLVPYRLRVEKRVELVMPRDSSSQVDLRELRFSYPGPAAAPAPTTKWLDASRLHLGMDSLRIFAVRDGVRQDVGVVRDELARVDFEGRPALRRTYRTTNSLYGDHHQVSHTAYPSLEALSDRSELGQLQSEVAYRADSIVGWTRLHDSARTPIALAARPHTHDAQAVDLMVRAADLGPGFHRSFEAFSPSRGRFAPMEAWVTGTATVQGSGGKPAEVWVVELAFDGLGSTMWIDRRTRALHRQVIRMGAGYEMVMERH